MTQVKRFLASIIASLFCVLSYAQHSTSSPYSTIGIGEVDSRIYGLNSGMANVGIGTYRQGFLNNTNPAAIAVDSSYFFIFDVSLAGSISRYSTAEMTEYTNNENVKKVAFGVRIFSKLAISAGILPYSNVQYRIQSSKYVEGKNDEKYNVYYEGSGGLSKTYLTATYKLFPYLYAGVNTSYLFGRINRSESLANQMLQTTSEVDKILFDFGLMYNKKITSTFLSAGLVFGYESKIKLKNYKTLSSLGTTETETSRYTSLPRNVGIGFTLQNNSGHSYKMVAIDYKFHNWANIKSPDQRMQYANNHRINAGAEYIPNFRTPRYYFQRVQYQIGAYFEKSNLVINGKQISEMGATAGIVLPLKNNYTQIFLSADVGRRGASGLINEKYVRINLGVSVNQLWFIKWVYQ
jgi:hypothetical protein